jgi:hypothetical protein
MTVRHDISVISRFLISATRLSSTVVIAVLVWVSPRSEHPIMTSTYRLSDLPETYTHENSANVWSPMVFTPTETNPSPFALFRGNSLG